MIETANRLRAWELALSGEPNTSFEFRSSTTLNFAPGTLVENLTEGNIFDGTNGSVVREFPVAGGSSSERQFDRS